MDPTDGRTLHIGVEGEGFFKTTDGGGSWSRASRGIDAWGRRNGPGLCYEEFYSTIIDPLTPENICISLAGGPGTLAMANGSAGNNGVYCSGDGGATWTHRTGPSMNTAVYTLASDPANFQVMYAGVNGGACSNPPPVCQPGTYINTTGSIYKTTDGGRTWLELDALYSPGLRVISIRVDANDSNTIFAATFSKISEGGPGNFQGSGQLGVLKSTDGGDSWTNSIEGMSASRSEQALLGMEVSPTAPQRLFVTASSNRSYWSSDAGATFHPAQARVPAFAFDPHDPTGLHMLACTKDSVKESTDGGESWSVKSQSPGFTAFGDGAPTTVVWSKSEPKTVFCAGPYAAIFRSTDGGDTWRQILSADTLP